MPAAPIDLAALAARIVALSRHALPDRALLVGISGIDGAGKGHVTGRLLSALQSAGVEAVSLNVDGWLNLPRVRFSAHEPAKHFYEHALRLDALFAELVLPLRNAREIDLTAPFAEETATEFRPHRYRFAGVEAILLEGIYLFKRAYRGHFDLAVWVDCPFEVALERALARGQEGLSAEATVEAYRTIYFPAQRIHFEMDAPREGADLVLGNGGES